MFAGQKKRNNFGTFEAAFTCASYRIRQLKGNLAQLASEMGNSPAELIDSYKRNVTDAQAAEWFNILPPVGCVEKVKAVLSSRQAA